MITLAIPHFNRFALVLQCLEQVIEDPRITEIVISDDRSTDGSWNRLQAYFAAHPKVKLFQNSTNQDCYRNKRMAVSRATQPWVILFDDDNILTPAYLDRLFALQPWRADTIYCPEWAQPHFDYRAFSGKEFTRKNVAQFFHVKQFTTLLNTANYFFHRELYLKHWDGSVEPHTADSIYLAYRFMSAGARLFVVPGLQYFHRVHNGSHYKLNWRKTGVFRRDVETQLLQLR